jgi:pSer/pThr/pTyr-binding forkhead associated (FHA) protein
LSLPLILRIFKNDQIVEVKQFHLDQVVIGRNAEVDLDLDDSRVSAIHALIEKRDDRFYICDLGSQSGTFKNGFQIIDEPIDSGDEIQLGSFKIVFNVGIPRPKSKPGQTVSVSVSEVQLKADAEANEASKTVPLYEATKTVPLANLEGAAPQGLVLEKETHYAKSEGTLTEPANSSNVVSKSEIKQTPATEKVSERPALDKAKRVVRGDDVLIIDPRVKKEPALNTLEKNLTVQGTFSPPSSELDVNKIIKPSKGSVLEVSIAWKERIIQTYHFSGNKVINAGAKETDLIAIPDSVLKNSFRLIELQGTTALVNVRPDMVGDLITTKGTVAFPVLESSGRMVKKGVSSQLRLDQGEALRISLLGGQVNIFIRFVPQGPKPLILPFLPFTVGEIASLLLAFAIVGLIALYNSIHSPIEVEDQAKEELLRMAQIIYQKPKAPPPDYVREKVTPPPEVKPPEAKPIEVKKVKMGDKTQAGSAAGNESTNAKQTGAQEKHSMAGPKSQGVAAEIKHNPNGHSSKKFSGSNYGGAIKLGDKAGANAKANTQVDLSKLGLASSFGSGGIRQKIDQAVSGAGGIMGDALSATGSSGFNKNRSGDDLGSAFKDTGASGKGTATEGITGGITKGRSTGYAQYGSDGSGLGDHRGVEVSAPGSGEFVGTIDREAVRRVIRSKLELVRNCYERELRAKPNLGGKVVISWKIVADGKAEGVRVKSSELNDSLIENCIVQEFYTWRFPEPPEGAIADVAFPFMFQKRD